MQITPTLYRIPKKVVISMTETEKKYDAIRRAYPETISKEQFYRIAHISKATALHLLQNGLVPCKDTGKKTRRYTIRTDDVITYLIDREIHPEKYGAPDHWYRDRSGYLLPIFTAPGMRSSLHNICMRRDEIPHLSAVCGTERYFMVAALPVCPLGLFA